MRNPIVKAAIAAGLCLALAAPAYSAGRAKDDRPVRKTTVNQQKTDTKTVPTTQPTDIVPPTDADSLTPVTPNVLPSASDSTTPRAGEEVNWQVIASGGGLSSIGSMMLGSTIGQTAAGQSTIGSYILNSGFQQNFVTGGEDCCIPPMRGDVNYDGAEIIDISDLYFLINFMFTDGPAPVCFDEADIDASGVEPLDISDLIYLIDYMFRGGPEPPACP